MSVNLILAAARNGDCASRDGGEKFDGDAECDCLHAGGERVNCPEHTLCNGRGLRRAAKETVRVQPVNLLCLRRLAHRMTRSELERGLQIEHGSLRFEGEGARGMRDWERRAGLDMRWAAQPVIHRPVDAVEWFRGGGGQSRLMPSVLPRERRPVLHLHHASTSLPEAGSISNYRRPR